MSVLVISEGMRCAALRSMYLLQQPCPLQHTHIDMVSAERPGTVKMATEANYEAALQLINTTSPDIRLAAVQLLSAFAKQLQAPAGQQPPIRDQARVDVAFQKLCGVVTVEPWARIRLQALAGLSGNHHCNNL
eukprot:GHUV01029916.1.p2 GENE.GHUV01029916.1~~GHUV01029916.1.p2  ORF type:complete len:133 (+),score=21.57 GHUV01029916.1:690-1088(+)